MADSVAQEAFMSISPVRLWSAAALRRNLAELSGRM
jgi:hypothetical protein